MSIQYPSQIDWADNMNIQYSYEIVSVNEAGRCMEVVYTSDGNPPIRMGARLPYEGEALEDVIKMYAPVNYWLELKTAVVPPQVGTSGVVAPPPAPEPCTDCLPPGSKATMPSATIDVTKL